MKKLGLIAMGCLSIPLFIMVICLMALGGGGAGSVASPVVTFATEEEAYQYQYVGTELGVPWDLVMLADGIHAKASGISGLEDYNPVLTSLQFCVLMENKYELHEWDEEKQTVNEDGSISLEYESHSEWKFKGLTKYSGKDAIMSYVQIEENTLSYADVNQLVTAIYDRVDEKNLEDTSIKYEVTLVVNPDFEDVLRNYICLDEKNLKHVMELYDVNYLGTLYGYNYQFGDIVLPEIVQGDLSRSQLAEVAVSLLGHPYMMGGKSSQEGPPEGPLDCSGYVDWVYIQCFGVGVSTGNVPEEIPISGTALMWYACEPVSSGELQVGDLGFMYNPASMKSGQVNHVGIFLGTDGGKQYWIHCGGSYYGTDELPTGRVGISLKSGSNDYNPVDGSRFSPAMKGCYFKYYRRPQFSFQEGEEGEGL